MMRYGYDNEQFAADHVRDVVGPSLDLVAVYAELRIDVRPKRRRVWCLEDAGDSRIYRAAKPATEAALSRAVPALSAGQVVAGSPENALGHSSSSSLSSLITTL